ncbi:MAG: cache domain-containing protein [Devosia sp.]
MADMAALAASTAKKAAIIRNMHHKATRAIIQVAQDPAFPSYFEALHLGRQHQMEEAKIRIGQISLATQEKFQVEEMCLIDATGSEVSRIVSSQIAYDLSTEEADNAYFAASFEREPRSTYIAPLYISPDVFKWVVAYTTPIQFDGQNAAILHYEHGLDVYQAAINRERPPEGSWLVAVDGNGYIVSDSRREIAVAQVGESENPTDYFESFSLAGRSLADLQALLGGQQAGMIELDGKSYTVAYSQVADWTILAVEAH